MTILTEMTRVMLAVPGANAPDEEVAAWYELKAHLLEHIAAEGGPGTEDARRQAELAHRRSAELLGRDAAGESNVAPFTAGRRRQRARRAEQPGALHAGSRRRQPRRVVA